MNQLLPGRFDLSRRDTPARCSRNLPDTNSYLEARINAVSLIEMTLGDKSYGTKPIRP